MSTVSTVARSEVTRLPSRAGGQGDDPVPGPVGGPAGADQLGAGQPSRGLHPSPGPAVELGHVGPPPGVQTRLVAGGHVGRPGVDGGLQGLVPGGDGVDPALLRVPRHRLADVSVAQRLEGLALARVVLAAVLQEVVDGVGVAVHQGPQGPARADRRPAGGGRPVSTNLAPASSA